MNLKIEFIVMIILAAIIIISAGIAQLYFTYFPYNVIPFLISGIVFLLDVRRIGQLLDGI